MRRYINTPDGQVHLYDSSTENQPLLVCLHPLPYSGLFFDSITPLLSAQFRVISPDYPGFGGSDSLPHESGIEAWAHAIGDALEYLAPGERYSLLGFHTGCLVAAEMALRFEQRIARLALVDVPCFGPREASELIRSVRHEAPITASLDSLAPTWTNTVQKRSPPAPLSNSLMLLAEQLRAQAHSMDGFESAFSWPWERKLAMLRHETLVLATGSFLHGPSVTASKKITHVRLKELTHVKPPAFDNGREDIATEVRQFLPED